MSNKETKAEKDAAAAAAAAEEVAQLEAEKAASEKAAAEAAIAEAAAKKAEEEAAAEKAAAEAAKADLEKAQADAEARKASADSEPVEVYMLHGFQPSWDEAKEPKPAQWAKNSFQVCPAFAAAHLVKLGHAKRVSDMSEADLAKAGYAAE